MLRWLVDWFIARAMRQQPHPQRVVGHEDRSLLLMHRYEPFWPDEWTVRKTDGTVDHHDRPPWWRPFNILLHHWQTSNREEMHDHPRWSITIMLRGSLIEHTPWGSRTLTPGSIVVRSRKAIHALEMVPGEEPWTMFIVGRRNHSQNGFVVMPFGSKRPNITWETDASNA